MGSFPKTYINPKLPYFDLHVKRCSLLLSKRDYSYWTGKLSEKLSQYNLSSLCEYSTQISDGITFDIASN